MVEIRYHGRGGQGAVTSAELLAQAVIRDGRFAQAMPAFGAERRGAPVLAFNRINDEKIYLRSNVYNPDIVIVLDPTLFTAVDVSAGLKEDGLIIANTHMDENELREKFGFKQKLAIVDASTIAREEIGRPITNITILGSLIKTTKMVDMELLHEAINERFGPRIGDRNYQSLKRAHEETKFIQD